jgi:hypothetical protein
MDVEPLVTLNAVLALEGIGQDETLVLISLNKPAPFLCVFNQKSCGTLIRYIPQAFENPAATADDIRTSVAYFQAEIASGSSVRCVFCNREVLSSQLKEKMADLFVRWNVPEGPATFDPLSSVMTPIRIFERCGWRPSCRPAVVAKDSFGSAELAEVRCLILAAFFAYRGTLH